MSEGRLVEERMEALFRDILAEATQRGDERWKAIAQGALVAGRHSRAWVEACKEVLKAFDAN